MSADRSELGEKLAAIAEARGARDPLSINVWHEDEAGEVVSEPGRLVPISYHRADGKPRLRAQLGGNRRTKYPLA